MVFTSDMQRVMAFDFGLKKIGVAIGQVVTQKASPLGIVKVKDKKVQWGSVDQWINEWQPDQLVVGLPLHSDGSDLYVTEPAKAFAQSLFERYQIKVDLCDEILTTREAYSQLEAQGRRRLSQCQVDALSACLILEQYLAGR